MDKKRANDFKLIMIMYLITVFLRGIFAVSDKVLLVYPDELSYLDPARSFIQKGYFAIHNINHNWEPILYALFLAPFTLIKNSYLQIKILNIVNCIIMCSSVFPTYLLAKRILKERKSILCVCIFACILPELSMTQYFMAENLSFPLAIWLFYFIYLFEIQKENKKRIYLTCIISAACFGLYMCKSISLGYVCGILAVLALDILFHRKNGNIRYRFLELFVFLSSFIILLVLYKYFINTTADVIGTLYDTAIGDIHVRNKKEVFFYVFCLLSYIVYTLIGFFYFPIVYTGVHIKDLKKEERSLYTCLIISFLAIITAVSAICNTREDLFEPAIRIHMRYYAPLVIPFMILFFKSFKQNEKKAVKKEKLFIASVCISILAMLFILRIPKYGCDVDAFMLFAYKAIFHRICVAKGLDVTNSWIPMAAMLICVSIIILLSFLLLNENMKKKMMKIYWGLIFAICLLNNIVIADSTYAMNLQYQSKNADAVRINDYFEKLDGNILVVCKEFDLNLDTYLDKVHYTVKNEHLYDLFKLNNGIWNIGSEKIMAYYPWHPYADLNKVDYIIIENDSDIKLDEENLDKVNLEGVENYTIYKNKIPAKLNYFLPDLENEAIYIDFSEEGNAGQFMVSGWNGQEQESVWTTDDAVLKFNGIIKSNIYIDIRCRSLVPDHFIKFMVDGVMLEGENVVKTETGYLLIIEYDRINKNPFEHTLEIVDEHAVSPSKISDSLDDRILSLFISEIIIGSD